MSQFKPGQSGNPGGRPKGLERRAREAMRLREYTAKDGKTYTDIDAAFHCLIDMFFGAETPPRERIAAFREWCDRGYGKAKQAIELSDATQPTTGRAPADMTDEEIAQALDAIKTLRGLGAVASEDSEQDVSEH